MNHKTYTTQKGTALPLLNLRGKDYLEVKYRLVWFREEHPNWSIETTFISLNERSALAKATIKDDTGRIVATSHKLEGLKSFHDFIEKAETGAIGRALALIGYGTQFCADELDEGERLVDSPLLGQSYTGETEVPVRSSVSSPAQEAGQYVIPFGKKYRGKKLKDVPKDELEGYIEWLINDALKKGTEVSPEVDALMEAFEAYYQSADDWDYNQDQAVHQ